MSPHSNETKAPVGMSSLTVSTPSLQESYLLTIEESQPIMPVPLSESESIILKERLAIREFLDVWLPTLICWALSGSTSTRE